MKNQTDAQTFAPNATSYSKACLIAVFYGLSIGSVLATAIWRAGCFTLAEQKVIWFFSGGIGFQGGSCFIYLLIAILIAGAFLSRFASQIKEHARHIGCSRKQSRRTRLLAQTVLWTTLPIVLVLEVAFLSSSQARLIFRINLIIAAIAIIVVAYVTTVSVQREVTE